jgi:hypothetical protein
MSIDDVFQIILTMVVTCIVLVAVPYLLNFQMQGNFPTERWCNGYNESNLSGMISIHADYKYWCIKNETGWHLNTSRPMVLENSMGVMEDVIT